MKVNITLLTMITLAARINRPEPDVLLLPEPSEAGMEGILAARKVSRRRSSSSGEDGSALSTGSRQHASNRPTRLAGGLGLESAPIRTNGSAPQSRVKRALLVPPLSHLARRD